MTTDDRFVVLSALIDREPVDPDALAEALDDSEGRARLVDFIRLRANVGADVASDDGSRFVMRDRSRARTWAVRVALLLLPLAIGAAGGAWYVERMTSRPPTPDRVVQFVPGVDWK